MLQVFCLDTVLEDGVDDAETHRSDIGLYLYMSEVHCCCHECAI